MEIHDPSIQTFHASLLELMRLCFFDDHISQHEFAHGTSTLILLLTVLFSSASVVPVTHLSKVLLCHHAMDS